MNLEDILGVTLAIGLFPVASNFASYQFLRVKLTDTMKKNKELENFPNMIFNSYVSGLNRLSGNISIYSKVLGDIVDLGMNVLYTPGVSMACRDVNVKFYGRPEGKMVFKKDISNNTSDKS